MECVDAGRRLNVYWPCGGQRCDLDQRKSCRGIGDALVGDEVRRPFVTVTVNGPVGGDVMHLGERRDRRTKRRDLIVEQPARGPAR